MKSASVDIASHQRHCAEHDGPTGSRRLNGLRHDLGRVRNGEPGCPGLRTVTGGMAMTGER
jgi:hypothetical protein